MMNKAVKTYTLRIAGKDITLSTDDAPDLVHRVAVFADRRIAEASAGGLVAKEKATLLTCISLSEELILAQDENTRLRRELLEAKRRLSATLTEINEHSNEENT